MNEKNIDCIYDAVDSCMKGGRWNLLNNLFLIITKNAELKELDILLSYATSSLPGKNNIPARADFIKRCKELHPNPELWKGLE